MSGKGFLLQLMLGGDEQHPNLPWALQLVAHLLRLLAPPSTTGTSQYHMGKATAEV